MAGKFASRVRGLSELAFRERFGREEQCREALRALRWPKGFICPRCGCCEGIALGTRPLVQCRGCRYQASLTAGTIFHSTKLPLTTWFLAIWLVATAKNGISSVELGRRLGVKQTNAWSMKQKILQVMLGREAGKSLGGRVEMDDAYLGGERRGKRGRGAAGKTPFVAVVETTLDRKPRKVKLLPVKGFRKKEIEKLARQHLQSAARVVTDGLSCWKVLPDHGFDHVMIRTGSGRDAATGSAFRWVNTALGNIKAAIVGTYRHISPKHAGRYLASFAWRYNRRFQLDTMLPRFVHAAARTDPLPYRLLTAG